jgi:hypothetical protein
MTELSLDVWLIVFDHVSDTNTLWSVARNVSRHLRACVDEFFRHSVLRKCVVELIYSTIHNPRGQYYSFVYVPMQFTRFSENGTRAVFRQVQFKDHVQKTGDGINGSVRGWLPFIERYCMETKKNAPLVMNKSTSAVGDILWEKELVYSPGTLMQKPKAKYTRTLRDHTSIGRGDRPPYFISLGIYTHDTELVDLAIDCSAREISLDWRRTLSAFFSERQFIVLANQNAAEKRVHDKALDSVVDDVCAITYHGWRRFDRSLDNWRRARRKRLQPWVKKNKKRMSNEHRLMTEDSIVQMKTTMENLDPFRRDNLVELHDGDVDVEEIVPERCAKDHPDLMLWPANRKARKEAVKEVTPQRCTCIIL